MKDYGWVMQSCFSVVANVTWNACIRVLLLKDMYDGAKLYHKEKKRYITGDAQER